MKIDVVLGLQWGDEGKGKVVDVLAENYSVITRFQGGPNAGHSLHFEGNSYVLHTIPSGVFRERCCNIIGNGVVIDPIIFKEECRKLREAGVEPTKQIKISMKSHLILPTHRIIDAASEAAKGRSKIGSTLKGIGPTYMDKTGRNGLRVGDIVADNFVERYNLLKEKHKNFLTQFDYQYSLEPHESEWLDAIEYMKEFELVECEYLIDHFLKSGTSILAEGAQGTLLDVEYGTYPFVTSSNTITGGVCSGLGVAPNKVGKVSGVFKAYITRVGSGPLPTELFDNDGELLQKIGKEFGATTGRSRRTGWLDLVALKYAVMVNGVDNLIMTKADVLDTFKTIKIAVGYKVNGVKSDRFFFDSSAEIEPIYKEFEGWQTDLTSLTEESQFPPQLKEYIKFIETETGVPISIVSVGPDRKQTIIREIN